MKPALLVIDIQHWFFKTAFFSTNEGKQKLDLLILNINELIKLFNAKKFPIFHITTEHNLNGDTRDLWGKKNNSTVLTTGTSDVKELESLITFDSDIKVVKTRHSAFIRTNLEKLLKSNNVDTLIITGYSTNACVGLTAMDSYEHDLNVIIAGDAILGHNQIRVDAMLTVLKEEFGLVPISNKSIVEKLNLECTK